MNIKEPTRISSLSEFAEWVVQLDSEDYLFRGVSNKTFEIGEASAYRRLAREENRTLVKLLEINRGVIEQARRRGYDQKNGRLLSDLEILGELQHFRVATCLIDFTYSAEVALWFACGTTSSEEQIDGKVVAVSNDYRIKEITSDMLNKKIDFFFKEDEIEGYPLYQWQPMQLNNRVMRQHSVFLFGGAEINIDAECIIEKDWKEKIRSDLRRFSNISEDTLFPDFEGFSRQNTHDVLHAIPNYHRIASEAYQRNDYRKAIVNYDSAIRLNSNSGFLYYMRGCAKFHVKRYPEAMEDYDEAIRLIPNYSKAYHWRGMVKSQMTQYQEAIEDYDEAIRLDPDYSEAFYWRGMVKSQMTQYQEAIEDYDEAIRLAPNYLNAYYRRALAKKQIEKLIPAQQDLKLALLLAQQMNDTKFITAIERIVSEIENELEKQKDDIPF